ncbi:MAG: hypothetical protein IKC31_05720 [Clostridia bacterium]|nr:hypothetical protein [Clostridia bacterium]MBR2927055.1 hypothetical protein [Clostridia bacterium]
MAEISVQFSNQINGYNKAQVNQFLQDAEEKLQEKALALADLQQQVVTLEAKLNKITSGDVSVEEKLELYDKLMKKMDGDYTNILAPAMARAKAIEEKAQTEYDIRIDQARYAAEGIYAATAERIAGVVDENMDRMYGLLEEFIYSKTLPGRIEAFLNNCQYITKKVSQGIKGVKRLSNRAVEKVKANVMDKYDSVQSKLFEDDAFEVEPEEKEMQTATELAE